MFRMIQSIQNSERSGVAAMPLKDSTSSNENTFSVAIIPYTYNHTNFKNISIGDLVNLEFDMIGKYISKIIKNQS